MKVTPKTTEQALSAPLQYRAILLYGPDGGLVRERAERVRKIVLTGNDDPFAHVELTDEQLSADPTRLNDELLAFGLMAGKRCISLRDAGESVSKIIQAAAPSFHNQVFLIVQAAELTPRSSLRAWFEEQPNVAAIACYHDEVRDIQAIVNKTFSDAKISLGRDTVDYICSQLGNDRDITRNELEKLVLFAGDAGSLSLEDAASLIDYNRDAELDDIAHAAADRNVKALEQAITRQLRENPSPVAYIRALQRYFNRLYMIRARMDGGASAESVIAGLKPKVFYKNVDRLRRHAEQWSVSQISKALSVLITAELACKTSDIPLVATSSRRLFQVTQVR